MVYDENKLIPLFILYIYYNQDMDKQNPYQQLYPDMEQRYNPQQKQFMTDIKENQQKWKLQNVPISTNQQLKFHVIRTHKPWKDLVKQTINWVNKNIHPMRIVSLAVVLCHSTAAGQCTIFYNDSKDQYMKMKIAPFAQHRLSGAIIDSGKSWEEHHKEVMKSAAELSSSGGVICVSQLETGATHGIASSIVWFLQKS